MSDLSKFHQLFAGSIRWRVTDKGVEFDGGVVDRNKTDGTVRLIVNKFGPIIKEHSDDFQVPQELIIACIATESNGNTLARREEPGYISEQTTPNKVSLGLMQLLISTAREVCRNYPVDGKWLLSPWNNIMAGTRFISSRRGKTELDPPLVAAAYNAGGVYLENSPNNRWKLRCYPLKTGHHIDRFVRFYNDAVSMGLTSKG